MRRLLPVLAAAVTGGSGLLAAPADDRVVSSLKADERIVFFTTDACLSADGQTWVIPVHAWVHELETTRARKAMFATFLERKYGLEVTDETASNFNERVRLFVVDNERNKRVVVRIAGETFELPRTGPNGHTRAEVEIGAGRVADAASDGRLDCVAVLPAGDARVFQGTVNLIDPVGVSVVSDIDDTIKLTGVTDRKVLFDRTFFQDYEPVPGMPERYRAWARQGARFHFVSSSPWHLYEPLDAFFEAFRCPPRSVSLKTVRIQDGSYKNLFKGGTETKPFQIEPILERFPHRRFVLVGDSGEQDPEVYGALMRKFPGRIVRVFIRNVDGSARTDARYRTAFDGVDPSRWALFDDPTTLVLPEDQVE